jgi:hypothetical protein
LPPAAPSGLSAGGTIQSIILDWLDNTEIDLAGYNVYRSTASGGPYVKLTGSLLTDSNYTDTDISIGTTYYYVVTAVDTAGLESVYSGEVSSALGSPASGTGAILREWWNDIPGTATTDLLTNENYPDNPSGRELITKLEGPVNWNDNYGDSIQGYLNPITNGNYTFWIASYDASRLYLSTDTDPANIVKIASVPDFTGWHEWTKYSLQQSDPIPLLAGQKYYIMAVHKADVGDDYVSVAWEGPGISQQVIDGIYLSPCGLKFLEFANFAGQWGRIDCNADNIWCSGNDFNRDGTVDIEDLISFADGWLTGIDVAS